MTPTKKCSRCGCTKSITDFHRSKRDGHQANCKPCNIAQRKERLMRDPRLVLLEGAKRRAKRLGIPCTLKLEDVVVPDQCPVLGIELCPATGAAKHNSPTLDRINPGCPSGYSPQNTRCISMRANTLKSDHTRATLSAQIAQRLFDTEGDADARSELIDYCVIEADLIRIEEEAA